MKRILIAGASGYLGKHAVAAFYGNDWRVCALVRNPEKLSRRGPHMEPDVASLADEVRVGDVTEPATLSGCCEGCDTVLSCVGMTRPDGIHSSDEVDRRGNERLLEEALRSGVRKFIYISVFNAALMPEIQLIQAHEAFAKSLLAAPIHSVIIRPTGFFSDMGQFLSMARNGIIFLPGEGNARINPIHGADLADQCVAAASNQEERMEIDAGGPDTFTYREIAELAFRTLSRPPIIVTVPEWIGASAGFLAGFINPQLQDVVRFAVSVCGIDNVAPIRGTRRLEPWLALLARP